MPVEILQFKDVFLICCAGQLRVKVGYTNVNYASNFRRDDGRSEHIDKKDLR